MVIRTKKGNAMPLCNGFLMCKQKLSSDGLRQFWECKDRKSGCRGRAVSTLGSLLLTQTQSHDNHGASPVEVKKKERLTMVKILAMQSLATTSQQIVTTVKAGLSEEEIGSMPMDCNMQRMVTNARKPQGAANVDKDLVQMVLSDDFKSTTRGGRFLLWDSRVLEGDKPVILIFASDRGLDFLMENRRWSIDGTFFCCPVNFAQLFTINCFKEESTLPCIFFLLPNKSAETYHRAFKALFENRPELVPLAVMSDFETAPLIGLKQRFPAAKFTYCLFHQSQSVFGSLKKKGLISLYDNNEVKALLRCLSALAFLPVDEVEIGFDNVAAAIEAKIMDGSVNANKVQDLRAHLLYFESTYVRRLDGNNLAVDALFPVAGWNVYSSVLNKAPRTNNAMEGWHREFNKKFPKRNLTLSYFIVRLKEEEERTWQLAIRHEVNPADPVRYARSKKVENSERQIFKLIEDYSNADVLLRQRLPFLLRMQNHMAKFYNPVAGDASAPEEYQPVIEEEDADEEQIAPEHPNFIFDVELNIFRRC